jgi:hypothetical protein
MEYTQDRIHGPAGPAHEFCYYLRVPFQPYQAVMAAVHIPHFRFLDALVESMPEEQRGRMLTILNARAKAEWDERVARAEEHWRAQAVSSIPEARERAAIMLPKEEGDDDT